MEICKCGHRRIDHKISDSSCMECDCKVYEWDRIKQEQMERIGIK